MRWLLGLVLLIPAGDPVEQDSVYLRMKIAYCYTRYSVTSQRTDATPEVRARAKANADSLFPRYQRALEVSKGTLTEVALDNEVAKARITESRDLSAAERFMIRKSCDRLVTSEHPTPQ